MLIMTEMTSFARWLERELAARRINRSQLAAYMGRRAQTVSAWFNDGRLPSTEVCADLARVLHVPLEEVLRQAGHLPPEPEYPEPEPHIIPEALRLLREMPDEGAAGVCASSARTSGSATAAGTPGDDAPVCVSELAIADRCEP